MLSRFYIEEHVREALKEDIGFGDITTENLAGENDYLEGFLNTRSDGVLCGVEVFKTVYEMLSKDIKIKFYLKELLMGERLSLNYIQRMSGIATETAKYQAAIAPYPAKIVDTRKTTPNFRAFEKYSVKTGGGALHRFNLSDCAMIKDNHIRLAGSITNAVTKLRASISHAHKIEVECDTLDQVKEAIECKADIIMLDNMSTDMMKTACEMIAGRAIVEASGNVHLDTVNAIAACGVDIISSSAIVAKAPTLDIALDM